jgi:hypothetical protein
MCVCEVQVSGGSGLLGFSFHASKSWQSMSSQMSSQQSVYTRTPAQCCVYDVLLDTDMPPPPLDDNFVARIAGYDGSPAASYKLFDDFGTHVVAQVGHWVCD